MKISLSYDALSYFSFHSKNDFHLIKFQRSFFLLSLEKELNINVDKNWIQNLIIKKSKIYSHHGGCEFLTVKNEDKQHFNYS